MRRAMIVLVVGAVLLAGMGFVVATGDGGIVRPVGDFADQPVIDFEGRVFDHDSDVGVPDAYVIVNVVAYSEEPVTGFGALGCAAGEVVRTDAQGRYRFRWAWAEYGEKPPSKVSVRLKAYAPGWEYFPRERRLGTSWQSTHAEGPDIAMAKDEATFEERLAFVAKLNDNGCPDGPRADTWTAMLFAQQREVWSALCSTSIEPTTFVPWAHYEVLERYSVFAAVFAQNLERPFADETARSIRTGDLRAVARAALPELQRAGPSWEFPFPKLDSLNAYQWRLACDAMSPAAVGQWSSQ